MEVFINLFNVIIYIPHFTLTAASSLVEMVILYNWRIQSWVNMRLINILFFNLAIVNFLLNTRSFKYSLISHHTSFHRLCKHLLLQHFFIGCRYFLFNRNTLSHGWLCLHLSIVNIITHINIFNMYRDKVFMLNCVAVLH